MTYDYIFKYVVVGDPHVGKSSLLHRYVFDEFIKDIGTTIGVDFYVKGIPLDLNGEPINVKLQIYDTAGQKKFQEITKSYYRNSCAIIVVFDKTRKETFKNINIRMIKDVVNDNIELVLVGNKSDNENPKTKFLDPLGESSRCDDSKTDMQVSYDEAYEFALRNGMSYYETSAKTGDNIKDLFLCLSSVILRKMYSGEISADNGNGIKRVIHEKRNKNKDKLICDCNIS